jgi:hypothetical protein
MQASYTSGCVANDRKVGIGQGKLNTVREID